MIDVPVPARVGAALGECLRQGLEVQGRADLTGRPLPGVWAQGLRRCFQL